MSSLSWRLSTKQKHEIYLAYREGQNPREIASRFGIHKTYPYLLAKRRGYRSPDRRCA